MKIAYYMPFKPMGHKNPSGDLIIGSELFQYLQRHGAEVQLMSRFRCRWIFLKPWLWPLLAGEILLVIRRCRRFRPDIWVSYHCYYKAPDVLGALCCRLLHIPYVIFQGIYSTKRRRAIATLPGFLLNRMALTQALCVFTNKRPDEKNLKRLLPAHRLVYIPPGLRPDEFRFNQQARQELRQKWGVGSAVVIMAAAMFRPGVKTDGIITVIHSCRELIQRGHKIVLVMVGDGAGRQELEELAERELPGVHIFSGKVARSRMQDHYSAADIFAFPGIEESLGMVFLEAQCCGLPVVAYGDWGASEAVLEGATGLLSPAQQPDLFPANLEILVCDEKRRQQMGKRAGEHVRTSHDMEKNYALVLGKLEQIVKDTPMRH